MKMRDTKNQILAGLFSVVIALGGWVTSINSKVAVLESNSTRYEKVIEKNTEAYHRLEVVIEKALIKMEGVRK